MGRSRRLEGIRTRLGSDEIQRYRGTCYINGHQQYGPWTDNLAEATRWRDDMLAGARDGLLSRERAVLGIAAEVWLQGITAGTIRNRSGKKYKPSVVRDYKRDIKICVELAGAHKKLDQLRVPDTQVMVDLLIERGLSDSRVRHVLFCLRALYNWAIPRGYAVINPCHGLPLPAAEEERRERIAPPEEAAILMAALQVPDRTAVALACYAGLRAGELLALRWSDIDLDLRTIRIDRAIDTTEGIIIGVKTYAGKRNVPIQRILAAVLEDHASERGTEGLLFPSMRPRRGQHEDGVEHFRSLSALHRRLNEKWRAAGLEPLGLHEARHTFASMLIARKVNAKAVQTYMGHSSITITFDRYGHLFPGHEAETLRLLDEEPADVDL